MTSGTISVSRGVVAAAALGVLLTGSVATLVWLRAGGRPSEAPTATSQTATMPETQADQAPARPVETVVPLTQEAIERAGIVVAPVTGLDGSSSIRVTGIVEPNGYRRVVVTPLVAGRVTQVSAELGQLVRRGQSLATIYSPDLVDAHARLRSARAVLEAHDRELQRTEKLVAIGAASRQELERIHAEHTAQVTLVDSARARLELLGVSTAAGAPFDQPSMTGAANVSAPIDGTVTSRTANVGLNVDSGTPVFTVVDLSTVWVIAELYEQDVAQVRVGTKASVTLPAYPGVQLNGQVSYVDPQVTAETRTARVRVELQNARQLLRLGMYADVILSAPRTPGRPASAAVTVHRAAVQTVGQRSVVYVVQPEGPGRFIEREVALGPAIGERAQVRSGLTVGESIVVEGSFFLRAESERLGLR